ncbi:hypothetical protein [Chengkuizengella axinellae]|uniref:RHS repeat-associated core domain-containing protein n=1 Tax=Chengkuizengella axinellae TaxID=3064388 RepID=A0ABT9J2T5_9BACL|nr:hypothetical protein [Chengkuizengella sp. 2205SS18-9]MDP5275907.1 hypothetical protein [Chengkuizengella sp. 2205SS18-9]
MYDANQQEIIKKTTAYYYDNNGNQLSQKVNYILPHHVNTNQMTGGNIQSSTACLR